jgi:chromosome segregation ATPase
VLHAETTTKTVRSLGETIDALRKELDDMTMARDTVKDRLQSIEKQLAERTKRVSELEKQVVKRDSTIEDLRKELADMTAARDTLKDRLEYLEKQLDGRAKRVSELEKQISKRDATIEGLRKDLSDMTMARDTLKGRFAPLEKQLEVSINRVKELERQLDKKDVVITTRDATIEQLGKEVDELQNTEKSLRSTITDMQAQLADVKAANKSSQASLRWQIIITQLRFRSRKARFFRNCRDFVGALKREIQEAEACKFKDMIALTARNSRIKTLERMVQNYQEDAHNRQTAYSQELEEEVMKFQSKLAEEQQAHKSSLAAAKTRQTLIRWSMLFNQAQLRLRHVRFTETSKDFAKSMKTEYRLHGEVATKTIHSLNDEIATLKSNLAETERAKAIFEQDLRKMRKKRDDRLAAAEKRFADLEKYHAEELKKLRKTHEDRLAEARRQLQDAEKRQNEEFEKARRRAQDVDARHSEELDTLRKQSESSLSAMRKRMEELEKRSEEEMKKLRKQGEERLAVVQKQLDATKKSLNEEIVNLKKQLELETSKRLAAKQAADERIGELQRLIATLEESLKELQSAADATKSRLSQEEARLRSEAAALRSQLTDVQSKYSALSESSASMRASLRWRLLVTIGQDRERHAQFFEVAKDFSRAQRADHQIHVEFSKKTIKALNDTCSTQKEQLGEAVKREEKLQEDYDEIKRHMSVEQANSQRHVAELEKKLAESELQLKNARREHEQSVRNDKSRFDEAQKMARKETDVLRERLRDLEKKLVNEERNGKKMSEKLKSQLEKLEEQNEKLKKKGADHRKITDLEQHVERLKSSLDDHEKLLTTAHHNHKDELDAKDVRINALELECSRLQTSVGEYEATLESTRTSSSGQVSRLHAELRILREQVDDAGTLHAKEVVRFKSQRALLLWSWMCRTLRARRMHQKHVKLVQAFTSSELVEARNWAATSNTTIHSLNDQLLAAKTKANEVGELEEAVRARDNRISELTRMLQDTQTELDSIKTGIDHDMRQLQDENVELKSQLEALNQKFLTDAERVKKRTQELKASYEKQIGELKEKISVDADEAAAREHQAQLDFKSEMDAMTERLKTKYKTDTTFSQARLSQMREDYEKQLKELRQRLKTETEAAEQRAQQSQVDCEQQLADLAEVHKKEQTVIKFRHASSLGLRDKRIHELEALLLDAQNEWESLKSSSTSEAIALRRELSDARTQIEAIQAQWDAAEEAKRGEEVVGLEKSIYELKNSLEKLKNENSKLLIEVDSLKKMKDEYQKSADSLKQSNSILENQVENLKADLEAFSSKTAKASDAGAFLQAKLDAAEKALEETQTSGRTERANLRWVWMCRVLRARRLHQRHVSLVKAFTSAELTEAKQVADTTKNLIDALRTDLATAISKNEELEKARSELEKARSELVAQHEEDANALSAAEKHTRAERANLRWVWMCRMLRARRLHQRHVSLAKKFAFAELTEANNVTETSKKLIDTLKGELTTATSKIEELEKLQVRLDEKLAEALEKLRTGSAETESRMKQLKSDHESRVNQLKSDHEKHLEDLRERLRLVSQEAAEREQEAQASFKSQLDELKTRLRTRTEAEAGDAEARMAQMKADYETQISSLREAMAADVAAAEEREQEAQANFKNLLDRLGSRHKAKVKSDAEDAESRHQLMVAEYERQLEEANAKARSEAAGVDERLQQLKNEYEAQLDELRKRMAMDADEANERAEKAHAEFAEQMTDVTEMQKKELTVLKFRQASTLGLRDARIEELEKLLLESETSHEKTKASNSGDGIVARRELSELRLEYDEFKSKHAVEVEDAKRMIDRLQQDASKLRARCESLERACDEAAMRGKSAHATLMWRHVYRVVTVKEQHKRFLNIALGHSKAAVRELSMHKDTAQITVNSLKKQLKDASDLEQKLRADAQDKETASAEVTKKLEAEIARLHKQFTKDASDLEQKLRADAQDKAKASAEVTKKLEAEIASLHKQFTELEKEKVKTSYETTKLRSLVEQRDGTISDLEKMLLSGGAEHNTRLEAANRQIDRLQQDLNELNGRAAAEVDDANRRLTLAQERSAASLAAANEKIAELENELEELRRTQVTDDMNDSANRRIERLQQDLDEAYARAAAESDDANRRLAASQERDAAKLAAANEEIERLERELDELRQRVASDATEAATRRIQRLQKALDELSARAAADADAANSQLMAAQRDQQRDAAKLASANAEIERLERELDDLHTRPSLDTMEASNRRTQRLQRTLDDLQAQAAVDAEESDKLQARVAQLEQELKETESKYTASDSKVKALQEKLADLTAERSSLDKLQSTLEVAEANAASDKQRLEQEIGRLRAQLSDTERVQSKPPADDLVDGLKARVAQLEHELDELNNAHTTAMEKVINEHNFTIAKEIKDRENAARDYARIIEDLEGDLSEMTDSRDVAVSDMMKLRLRLDELERTAQARSEASVSKDPESMREIHVLRTKIEHLEAELVTERSKREREVQTLRDKLAVREREASTATNATNAASEEVLRVKNEMSLKITSQTTIIERLEIQLKELRAEYDVARSELGEEAARVSKRSASLVQAGKKMDDENHSLREQLDDALAELERCRVSKDFITKEFNFFQIEAKQNADLIQRKLERTQEQLNDAEVELAKLRAQVQEYAAEQEELMFESQRIQKASDAKISKLRSELTSMRVEYEEDLRTQVSTFQEQVDGLQDELNDERASSANALQKAKLSELSASEGSAAKIKNLEAQLAAARDEVSVLDEEIKTSQEAVEYAEHWAKMNDKRAQGAEEFLMTLKVEIAELKKALVLAKSQPAEADEKNAELQRSLDECRETCKSQLNELNELRTERDKLRAKPAPVPKNPTTGSATVNFDLGDEPTFEMPDIPKRRSPEPVVAAPPTSRFEYDVTDTVQRRYHTETKTVTTYDEEVEEPEDDYEPPVEYGTIEETEEILEIVEYDSDGNEIIVESRTLAPGEEVGDDVLDAMDARDREEEEEKKAPRVEQPVARKSGLWGRMGAAADDMMD